MLKCLQIASFWAEIGAISPLGDAMGPLKPLRIPAPCLASNPAPIPVRGCTSRSTWALIGALIALVGALALCLDRSHNGDFYLSLISGRFVAQHGFATHDPFATISQGGTWLNQQWLSRAHLLPDLAGDRPHRLTVLYAVLITAPLALLLWLCRRKGWRMLVAVAAFYFPGVLAVIHPRAAGFTVLIFTLLVALLVALWQRARTGGGGRRGLVGAVAILALFALWANLHGGFVAGLLLLGLATVGLAIDNWRGVPGSVPLSRVAVLGLVAVLAAGDGHRRDATRLGDLGVPAELPEPGDLPGEHRVGVGVQLTAGGRLPGAGDLFRRLDVGPLAPAPPRHHAARHGGIPRLRRLFGPQHRLHRPDPRPARRLDGSEPQPDAPTGPAAIFGVAAAAATLLWAVVLGPARDDPTLGFPVADYAIAHPPKHGRIVTYAGVGSYINWRSPSTRVVLNGWLEHYTPQELRDNYGVLRAWSTDLPDALRRIHAGAVITHVHPAIAALEAAGFRPEFTSADGTYLVRIPRHSRLSGP